MAPRVSLQPRPLLGKHETINAVASATLTGRVQRGADRAAFIFLLVSVALVAVVVSLLLMGYQFLVVQSGSMAPTIKAGDIVVTRMTTPDEVEAGDVVTFRDDTRENELVSHRVLKVKPKDGRLFFVTRGDANTGVERWSIERTGSLGIVSFQAPKVGYFLRMPNPAVRISLIVAAALLLGTWGLTRIWKS
jgi:signal peptidase